MQTLEQLFAAGVPNLDDEGNDALTIIMRAGPSKVRAVLGANARDDGAFTVAETLCKYAELVLDSRAERAIGQIGAARLWEREQQRQYETLPDWARW